jgi:hypothetical protein
MTISLSGARVGCGEARVRASEVRVIASLPARYGHVPTNHQSSNFGTLTGEKPLTSIRIVLSCTGYTTRAAILSSNMENQWHLGDISSGTRCLCLQDWCIVQALQ